MILAYFAVLPLIGLLDLGAAEPPIIQAARSGDISALRSIVESKGDVLAKGSLGQTALHETARLCDLEASRLLVDAGVDRLGRDSANWTAAMYATKCPKSNSNTQLIHMLMVPPPPIGSDESKEWSLQYAAARGNIEVVRMLLGLGVDVNSLGTEGNRALEIACRKGNAGLVTLLLENGADIRLRTPSGSTVLHEAALGGATDVVVKLIERGSEIDATDREYGETPLQFASSFGRQGVVEALVRYHANTGIKDLKGRTALDLAIANGHQEIAKLLKADTIPKKN